ncbi:hypothetical protein HanRHA438_Chr04g0162261 [Helianthus annuus]|nr:hypothetical protein HanRHA438_Chr04g0162261 [Helianthus annuus]
MAKRTIDKVNQRVHNNRLQTYQVENYMRRNQILWHGVERNMSAQLDKISKRAMNSPSKSSIPAA